MLLFKLSLERVRATLSSICITWSNFDLPGFARVYFGRTISMVYGELEPTGFAYLKLAVDEDLFCDTTPTYVCFEIGALILAIILTFELLKDSFSL